MIRNWLLNFCRTLWDGFSLEKIVLIMLGAAIASFGLHNIHQQTNITEGGALRCV